MNTMEKRKEVDTEESSERTCLYVILGVTKDATEEQIKKAYKVRALRCHPDKNPSEEAKANFQKLVSAYNILKSTDSRKLYDETGFIEGEGFDKAADFFRTKFGRISEQDIVDFGARYKGSDEEIEDVRQYYETHGGNIADLLEWIPLSEPSEVDRFIGILDGLISAGTVKHSAKYKSSMPKLRKNADTMAKEMEKVSKDHENKNELNTLVLAIQEKRRQADESFLDSLVEKYGKSKKKSKK